MGSGYFVSPYVKVFVCPLTRRLSVFGIVFLLLPVCDVRIMYTHVFWLLERSSPLFQQVRRNCCFFVGRFAACFASISTRVNAASEYTFMYYLVPGAW